MKVDKKQIAKILSNAKMQYAYEGDKKIYTAKFTLKGKPRIFTMVLSQDSVEFSLSDLQGNVLEVITQQGSNLEFMNLKG